ncbi:anthranilate phosphoribosyltransferase SCDLUD_003193 [Saccharomycodes ludwigii]|uniref:anthranilate phosphoribosyltransferase n=1 Tax=Saccharomycodes ludwigii TaxID=36035 RepID=UPI001E88E635|nr:hypothetical protein SCDLUD_003193 [Saccharomycodes ludwigii]KAH3900222.1 hypothetical protein SCDLUD_003193 [Saccharomycodes ludwigii]
MSHSIKNVGDYTKKILCDTFKPQDLFDSLTLIIQTLETIDKNQGSKLSLYVNISSFLTALRTKGLDHKADYIAAAAKAILQFSDVIKYPVDTTHNKNEQALVVADIVGTGGDGQNTFNVSTSSAIVVSGIKGIKIVKHGGKASTSNSGAGDLINVLGVDSTKVNAGSVEKLYASNDFMFLLASQFHKGMFHVAEIRKMMKIPTIFNVLGPLLHPMSIVNKRILGVYSKDLGLEYLKAARLVYPNNDIFVVWGHVGLDEISPIGKTTVWCSQANNDLNTEIKVLEISPLDFGLMEHPLADCQSLGPAKNADILANHILQGEYRRGENAIYDYILLNSAMLYCLCFNSKDYKKAVDIVEESIHNGSALKSLQKFVKDVEQL